MKLQIGIFRVIKLFLISLLVCTFLAPFISGLFFGLDQNELLGNAAYGMLTVLFETSYSRNPGSYYPGLAVFAFGLAHYHRVNRESGYGTWLWHYFIASILFTLLQIFIPYTPGISVIEFLSAFVFFGIPILLSGLILSRVWYMAAHE